MATTPYTALIQAARFHINAARGSGASYKTDKFWSDDELFNIALRGTTDMWGAIVDLHQEHYLTVDETNVSLASSATQLSGVPVDTFRVYMIEPLDPTVNQCAFVPRPYNHIEFINARSQTVSLSFEPTSGVNIFYDITGLGAPNAAPIILVAPKVSAAVSLRFVYVPTLNTQNMNLNSNNPIPGESDHAIIAWIVAYARGKEREDRSPDPGWLAVYATEKNILLTRMNPRQEQEARYADGMFDGYWR